MSDTSAAPIFQACDTKRGADWSVLVTWPDERLQYLDGFGSFDETVAWINDKSRAWLEAQQIHPCPSPPRRHDHIWSRFETAVMPANAGNAKLADVAAIDQLIDVINTHKDSARGDRMARGEAFKDEQGSE